MHVLEKLSHQLGRCEEAIDELGRTGGGRSPLRARQLSLELLTYLAQGYHALVLLVRLREDAICATLDPAAIVEAVSNILPA